MIIEWIWGQVCAFLGWLLSLFPTVTVPDWVDAISGYITDGVAYLNSMHNWVPLDALRVGFLFVVACSAIVLAVRVFRIVLSLFTGGGGSAA